jgi:hypothetical protein
VEEVVAGLEGGDAAEPPLGDRRHGQPHLPGLEVGDADVEDLAVTDQTVQGLEGLVQRRAQVAWWR